MSGLLDVKLDADRPPEDHRVGLIITSSPTPQDETRAKAEHKTVMVFLRRPAQVKTIVDGRMWVRGFLHGCGLAESPYVAVNFVPEDMDIEQVIGSYQRLWSESMTMDYAGAKTSLAGSFNTWKGGQLKPGFGEEDGSL